MEPFSETFKLQNVKRPLTFYNFSDVKLHVEVWIFAVVRGGNPGEKNDHHQAIPSTAAHHLLDYIFITFSSEKHFLSISNDLIILYVSVF